MNHPGPDNCMNAIYYNQQTTRDLTSNLQVRQISVTHNQASIDLTQPYVERII